MMHVMPSHDDHMKNKGEQGKYRQLLREIPKLSCDIKVMQDHGIDTSYLEEKLETKQEELKKLSRERHNSNSNNENGLLIVVSAPSGTGKTTICKKILEIVPNLRFSVSYTTRPPRQGERNGNDYYFISEDEFRKKINAGEFAEWAENYGHLYGTSFLEIKRLLDSKIDILLDVDPRGAKALKERYPDGIFVFVLPPSIDVLEARLKGRRSEKDDMLRMRLNKAMDEMKEALWYDYAFINERIEDSLDIVRSIYIAEKSKRKRVQTLLQTVIKNRR